MLGYALLSNILITVILVYLSQRESVREEPVEIEVAKWVAGAECRECGKLYLKEYYGTCKKCGAKMNVLLRDSISILIRFGNPIRARGIKHERNKHLLVPGLSTRTTYRY